MNSEIKQSILVVDDVAENIELLARLLGNQVEVLFALSGEDAIRLCQDQAPDLVLLDIMMPGMDGYQVLAQLKANPKTALIPVIFVTGIDARGEEARGIEAGAVDYIVKPLHPAVIRARVKNHLELKRYRDFLENLSATDGLTGLANRRRFDEALDREWRRSARNHNQISLLMIDVDCFKAYNDKYGHLEGDQVLRYLATVIQTKMRRPPDLAARYGGEEFACILPETDQEGAASLAEQIRLG
ncbi:MAG: diguanylate cyclase, partial [Leptonema sp. (in: Bacteria)]|nr:diguanylate cyclase [Leptonema sp. (in: bacteria)]